MGIVISQSIRQSIIIYIGAILGALNVLFIYPAFLGKAEFGILNYIRETSAMISIFSFLGSTELIIRYFPHFKDEAKKHHGFLFLLNAILALGSLLTLLAYAVFRSDIQQYFSQREDARLYLDFVWYIPVSSCVLSFSNLYQLYASNFHRTVVPSVINELIPKIGLPLLVVAYYFEYISLSAVFAGFFLLLLAMMVLKVAYVHHLGQLHLRPDFRLLNKARVKEMASYCGYGFLGGLGSRLSSEFISIFMVGTLITLKSTAVYAIAYFISNVIDIPRKAISSITSPLLAQQWKEGKMKEISDLYAKSSLNQLIVALGIFLSIWVSIDEIYAIIPKGSTFAAGKWVVLFLGISRVVDMMTGVNTEILSYSRYYRYNFYLILMMAAIHICTNLLLIPHFSISGVGLATLISIFVFNAVKFVLIKWKLGMQPFSRKTMFVLVLAGIAFLPPNLMPGTGFPVLDAALRSGLFASLFAAAILYFRISPDFSSLWSKALRAASSAWQKRQGQK
jgi:O-antigen/teichoic acid export membrane protein